MVRAVIYEAEYAECDGDHPDAEQCGGGSPCRVPNVSPQNTMQLHQVIASYEGNHSVFTPAVTARKQQDSLVMRRSGGRSEACLSICWGSSRPHQDAPGQIPGVEISRHPSRVREEAVVIRTDSNADSNPSRHVRHDLDPLARLDARAGRWWMRSDYLRTYGTEGLRKGAAPRLRPQGVAAPRCGVKSS